MGREVKYPKRGTSQKNLEAWIECEIKARIDHSVQNAKWSVGGGSDEPAIFKIQHWAIRLLVANLMKTLDEKGGPNCLEVMVGPIRVTMVRPHGKSPMELLDDMRAEMEKVVAHLNNGKSAAAIKVAKKAAQPPQRIGV